MEDYKKKYEDALERMKSCVKGEHPECFTYAQKAAEFIFPELKESKDEKIRKALISVLTSDFEKDTTINDITVEEIVDWLKKQGEQKPVDKTESKFHVKDWVVTDKGDTIQIGAVNPGYYTLNNGMEFSTAYVDKYWKLWAIKDAKPGDVLATNDGKIFIYHKHDNNYVYYYFSTNYYNNISLNSSWNIFGIKPATKEQREILFQKMKEAGYEWDAKKLNKIEQPKLTAFEEAVKGMMDEYMYAIGGNPDAITEEKVRNNSEYLLSLIPQKPTGWTEEDANMFGSIRSTLSMYMNNLSLPKEIRDIHEEELKWLDELYDRGLS